jgi:uncharacterized protein YbbC (DUF1343 family)
VDGRELANYLNSRRIPGIRIYPTRFQPNASNFSGKWIDGIRFVVTDREAFNSTRFGLELGSAIAKLFPGKMTWQANQKLVGNKEVLRRMEAAEDPAVLETVSAAALTNFQQRRSQALLY